MGGAGKAGAGVLGHPAKEGSGQGDRKSFRCGFIPGGLGRLTPSLGGHVTKLPPVVDAEPCLAFSPHFWLALLHSVSTGVATEGQPVTAGVCTLRNWPSFFYVQTTEAAFSEGLPAVTLALGDLVKLWTHPLTHL